MFDAESIKKSLLTDYKSKLNADIRNSGFGKTWDQLYRGGYIKDEDGNQMIEGDLAWKTIKDINQGIYNKAADTNDDNEISDEELKEFKERTENAARRGLANYYSEMLAPQNDENLDTKTIKMNSLSQYTNQQKQAFEEDKDSYYKFTEDIDKKNYKGDPAGIVKVLNETRTAAQRSKDNPTQNQKYMTGKEYNETNPPEEMFGGGLPEGSIVKIIGYDKPVVVMTADEVKTESQVELNNLIFDVSGYDGAAKGYFNILDQSMEKETRTFDTRKAAEKAYGASNVIANPDGTFGKK